MNKQIRVLHVVNLFYSGGIREFIMNYYKSIDREHIKFLFLVQRDFKIDQDDEIISLGGEVVYGPKMYKNELGYYNFLKKYLMENEIDVVHSHLNLRNFIPLFAAKHAGIKNRISHCHKNELNENIITKLKRYIIRFLTYNCSTTLCACSNKAAFYMYGNKKFIIIRNAIDILKFCFDENTREKYRLENKLQDKFVIGHVGNFSYEKNHTFLIDIFNEIQKQRKNSLLMMIGDGEKINEIRQKVKELNLENKVLFMGMRKDTDKLYNCFDVFVFPSKSEGFGMAILEAECNGLNVIVSKEIQSEACINGLYKKVSLNQSPKIWADILLKYENKNRTLSCKKIEILKKFDINNNVKIMENIYKENRL